MVKGILIIDLTIYFVDKCLKLVKNMWDLRFKFFNIDLSSTNLDSQILYFFPIIYIYLLIYLGKENMYTKYLYNIKKMVD